MNQSDSPLTLIFMVLAVLVPCCGYLYHRWRSRSLALTLGLVPDREGKATRSLNRLFVDGARFSAESVLVGRIAGFHVAVTRHSETPGTDNDSPDAQEILCLVTKEDTRLPFLDLRKRCRGQDPESDAEIEFCRSDRGFSLHFLVDSDAPDLVTADLKQLLLDHEQYLHGGGRVYTWQDGLLVRTYFGGFMDWDKVPTFINLSVNVLKLLLEAQRVQVHDAEK
jgi:hypothetical protein